MKNHNIVLFTGGTGGHVIPAINHGNFLINNGHKCTIFLDSRGLKYAKKFKGRIILINSGHLSGNIFYKLKSILLLISGLFKSIYFLSILRPSFCIGFGSYASFMPLIVATFFKFFNLTEIYLHEQNSVIGKVNLFFKSISKYIFINFNNIQNIDLVDKGKVCVVGLPTNNQILFNRNYINHKEKNNIKIFLYGGSQGSLKLNNSFVNILKKLPNNYFSRILITIQSPKDIEFEINRKLENMNIKYISKPFFHNIEEVLKSNDIIISRSGAGTINDITKFQAPSLLVPLPHSINNHQYYNAKYLVDRNAALLIQEKDLDTNDTIIEFKKLLDNISVRNNLIKNLKSIKILDANTLMMRKTIK